MKRRVLRPWIETILKVTFIILSMMIIGLDDFDIGALPIIIGMMAAWCLVGWTLDNYGSANA